MPQDLRVTGPVKIAGANVTDLDPSPVLNWRLVLPNQGLTFDTASVLEPTADASKDAVYVLELSAQDRLGNKSSGFMTLERYTPVSGTGPEVTMGGNLVIKSPAKPVVSVSSNSQPVTYSWATTSGPANLSFNSSTDMLPIISAPQDGVYVATLTATDAQKRASQRSLVIVWDTKPPVITLQSPMTIKWPKQPVISATDMSWNLSYSWEQISGPGILTFSNPAILNPFISASATGSYNARITVTDAAGNQAQANLVVNWTVPDTKAPEITMAKPMVIFSPTAPTGIVVVDSDSFLKYLWDQVSGPGRLSFNTSDKLMPVISANQVGDYIARLTATDSSGNRSESFLNLKWISGDTTPPEISMTSSMTITQPTAPASVVVTDASPYTLKWSQVSGPGSLLFSNSTIATPLISANVAGSYVARLTATDSSGNQSSRDLFLVWIIPDTRAPQLGMGPMIRTAVPVQPDTSYRCRRR